ncbi:MAG TPA: ADOP family duplicated permease [Terriglobales bacterium]|nr:ADOP family duplicated permease [Terriglobales bacterium]
MPAFRGLRRPAATSLWAIAILALGIGAATALFSLVNAVILRPLPISSPQAVLAVGETSPQSPALAVSFPDFLDWQQATHSFAQMAATRPAVMALTHLGPPAMVNGERVTAGYFPLLGAHAALGRVFSAADDAPGAPAVVVVSSDFFRTRLAADARRLGGAIELDGQARTVIGVMPPGFPGFGPEGADAPQYWTPLGPMAAADPGLRLRSTHSAISVLARLRPGVSLEQGRGDLAAVAARLAQQYPASNTGIGIAAVPLLQSLTGDAQPALWGLLAAVGLLLLLACANVANLLLAHATTQRTHDAIYLALGAAPGRLLRHRLRHSLGLGLAGAALGCGFAWLLLRSAAVLLAGVLPRTGRLGLDLPVLAFALACGLITALLCGLAPALAARRVQPAQVLTASAAGRIGGRSRLRSLLVAGQTALALLLLVGAGLLLRSLAGLEAVDPGFNPRGAWSFIVGLPDAQYPNRAAQLDFFRQADERLAHIPGVSQVGGAFPLPFTFGGIPQPVAIPGHPQPPRGRGPTADIYNVRGDYFAAMGMHLVAGRAFTGSDNAAGAPVAIVDDHFAARFWPGGAPTAALGQRITAAGATRTVVGVVAHVNEAALDGAAAPEAYVPQEQSPTFSAVLYFVLRTPLARPSELRAAALAAIASVDPNQPITDTAVMSDRVAATLTQRRLAFGVLGLFAVLALLLAALGVYGVLSYTVAQRTRELGLRMALGADRGRVLRLVLRQGMMPVVAGALAGVAAALLLGKLLAGFLYGIGGRDPLTLIAAPLLLLAVAAAAAWWPARRATRVDPILALRAE